ncbi:MAG: TIGR04222 domain-containing membrane protein, partial [Pseudomonadota bacterium]|nr:TIGR04222 domain-containing membrane protein [Pseudomonadota bacterium]
RLPDATAADALWQRLHAHAFEDADHARTLCARMAQANGWPPAHAQRVLHEYRRFLWLAVRLNGQVCPSDAVDEAWHAHLLDSRAYFGDFCPRVLGRALHHFPSRGSADEGARHQRCYADTLAAYEAAFGQPPPPDIWPAPAARFATRHQRVDLHSHWVWRKPRWARGFSVTRGLRGAPLAPGALPVARVLAVALLVPALIVSGCVPGVTVLPGVSGPHFVLAYLAALLVLVAWGAARLMYPPRASWATPAHMHGLGAVEIAYLAAGADRAVATAMAQTMQRERWLSTPSAALGTRVPPPHALAQALQAQGAAHTLPAQAAESVGTALDTLHAQLHARGLLRGASRQRRAHSGGAWALRAAWVVLWVVGGLRVLHGWQRGLPVGHLLLLGIVSLVVGAVFWWRLPQRLTRAGQEAVRRARLGLRRRKDLSRLDPLMPLGLALLGTAALADDMLPLKQAMARRDSAGGSGCGGTAGTAGSDGGGSGGCSGSAGCGGCGGGD